MIALVLSLLPAVVPADEAALDRIDRTLQKLLLLQQEIRDGKVPTLDELAIARISRSQLLRSFDARVPARLGVPMVTVRDRLIPVFDVELRMLSEWALDPSKRGPSPVLERLYELESEWWTGAHDLLEARGIANPLLPASVQQALAQSGTDATQPVAPAPKDPAPPGAAVERSDSPELVESLIQAEAFYAAHLWERALTEYSALSLPLDSAHLDVHYRMADCLLKLERHSEAAEAFRRIADRFPDTTLGKSANWNAELARTIALVYGEKPAKEGQTP